LLSFRKEFRLTMKPVVKGIAYSSRVIPWRYVPGGTRRTIMTNYGRLRGGFTLIELMIVVAIIAIIAAIAIPAYQVYVIRSQVSEGFVLFGGVRPALEEYYASHGSFPPENDVGGIEDQIQGSYVSMVDARSQPGKVIINFNMPRTNAAIRQKGIIMSAVTSSGSIVWTCDRTMNMPAKYLPTGCRY
jgi:type IV pilus assembly protein PilA